MACRVGERAGQGFLAPAAATRPILQGRRPFDPDRGLRPQTPIGPKGLVLKRRAGWDCLDRRLGVSPSGV